MDENKPTQFDITFVAIAVTPYARHAIDDAKCTRCNICRDVCPHEAIDVVSPR